MLTGLLWKHDIYFSPQKQDSYTSCTAASGWCIADAESTPFSPHPANMSTEFFSEAEIIQSNQRNSPSALVPDVCPQMSGFTLTVCVYAWMPGCVDFVRQSMRLICQCSWAKANSRCEITVLSYFEVSRCGAIKALPNTKAALLYLSYHPSYIGLLHETRHHGWGLWIV